MVIIPTPDSACHEGWKAKSLPAAQARLSSSTRAQTQGPVCILCQTCFRHFAWGFCRLHMRLLISFCNIKVYGIHYAKLVVIQSVNDALDNGGQAQPAVPGGPTFCRQLGTGKPKTVDKTGSTQLCEQEASSTCFRHQAEAG